MQWGKACGWILACMMLLAGCANASKASSSASRPMPSQKEEVQEMEEKTMKMWIGNTEVAVEWEDNASVEALQQLVEGKDLEIHMSMYGGFEQVGSIGASLLRNDAQATTQAGDVMLYSGNQMVVFYGSNSWAYTRLGRITDKTQEELADLLGNGDAVITISYR